MVNKRLKKRIPFIVIILALLIVSIYVALNLVQKVPVDVDRNEWKHSTADLDLHFNGETMYGITAITAYNVSVNNYNPVYNEEFRAYLVTEMDSLSRQFGNVENIDISYSQFSGEYAHIKINYTIGTIGAEMNETLYSIKSLLENRWYISGISLNWKGEYA